MCIGKHRPVARLVHHGPIAKCYGPTQRLRELRELLCYRRKLVERRAGERNRLLKLLETANIKLASVMSDVFRRVRDRHPRGDCGRRDLA